MREAENIDDVSQLDIDLMGFIFWSKSPRNVQQISSHAGIMPDYADGNQATKKRDIKRVGVFVDEMPQTIVTRVYNYHLDYIQLHGHESPTMIDNLKRTLIPDIAPGIKVIKAISVACKEDIELWKRYEGLADMFLFDTKCKCVGGSGDKFDWDILQAYDGDIPFILSGGIGPDDAARVKTFSHPQCIGIDLNSRFEDEPALKNIEKLNKFISEIRNSN